MSDKHRFSSLMDDLGIVYDKAVSADIKRLYWEDLGHLPIETIERAIQGHRRDPERGRFWPKPADLLSRCRDPAWIHPAGDAAWSIALESLDEAASVIVTDEILQARAAALPVWTSGDKVGARMAFKAAYEQIVSVTDQRPRWRFSAGHDSARRAETVERALQQGLLPQHEVAKYLPAPAITESGRAIAGLLTGNVVAHPSSDTEQTRARLAAVKAALATSAEEAQAERAARQQAREEEAKARHARRHGMTLEERTEALEAELAARKQGVA